MSLKIKYHILAWVVFPLFFLGCTTNRYTATSSNYCLVKMDSVHVPEKDSHVESMISTFKAVIDKQMDEVLAYSETEMKSGNPDGALNDFLSDLILNESNTYYSKISNEKIDICLLNNGGLRAGLPKGNILKRHIFELMPFENELVVAHLKGETLQQMLDYIAYTNGQPVAGLKMGISNQHPTNILIQGKAFDKTKTYLVVTSDYLFGGGDNMNFFKQSLSSDLLHVKVRDAIISYLSKIPKSKHIQVQTDNRIYSE